MPHLGNGYLPPWSVFFGKVCIHTAEKEAGAERLHPKGYDSVVQMGVGQFDKIRLKGLIGTNYNELRFHLDNRDLGYSRRHRKRRYLLTTYMGHSISVDYQGVLMAAPGRCPGGSHRLHTQV